MAARAADWRAGAVVYQVFVDRFAPSADLAAKATHYAAPRRLLPWSTEPVPGGYLPEHAVWQHEVDFWGGDLASVQARLDHPVSLGADVVYLNPIVEAFTNHKYDATDHLRVSPEYGSRADLTGLVAAAHERGLRVVLDGVFNHVGRRHPRFLAAAADPAAPERAWFTFGDAYPAGYAGWADVPNLPELRLEDPAVRAYLWGSPGGVVPSYLADGVDGWRLDVAFEIGARYLRELTDAAHRARAGSLVVGEVWNAPTGWDAGLDGILNTHARRAILDLCTGDADPRHTRDVLADMTDDAGIEFLLRCWLFLENHDTPRLTHLVPDPAARRIATVLQATLPGAPNLYYGQEVAMAGGEDPANRAPMRWDLVDADVPDLRFLRHLYAQRRARPALVRGDVVWLRGRRLLAFLRTTDLAAQTCLVVVNPSDDVVRETVPVRDGRLMADTAMVDVLAEDPRQAARAPLREGFARVELPPRTAHVYAVAPPGPGRHTPYKRTP